MRVEWKVSAADGKRLRRFVDELRDTPFVQARIQKNLTAVKPRVSRQKVWKIHLGCLLTTQQRSGPESPVGRFMRLRPFPLTYGRCRSDLRLDWRILRTLTDHGGIRRTRTIAAYAAENLQYLEAGAWSDLLGDLNGLRGSTSVDEERRVADSIADALKGFGPKQSRNLIQWLGLSRYETPLDSRITKWLNEFGFPVDLSPVVLSDRSYYHFVADGFQALCARAGEYPCVVDAAIFSSFDGDAWTRKHVDLV